MTQQMRGMNVTWLVGFLFCVAALAPGEGSALRAGDQIVQCAKTKVKGAVLSLEPFTVNAVANRLL